MNKGGTGVGSASVVLVFAVLCLTVFALISLVTATADRALAAAAAGTVKSYYRADTQAEEILADILESETVPDSVRGVEIIAEPSYGAVWVTFLCPISDAKELYVKAAIFEDSYDILAWQARDTGQWEIEEGPSVWSGDWP